MISFCARNRLGTALALAATPWFPPKTPRSRGDAPPVEVRPVREAMPLGAGLSKDDWRSRARAAEVPQPASAIHAWASWTDAGPFRAGEHSLDPLTATHEQVWSFGGGGALFAGGPGGRSLARMLERGHGFLSSGTCPLIPRLGEER